MNKKVEETLDVIEIEVDKDVATREELEKTIYLLLDKISGYVKDNNDKWLVKVIPKQKLDEKELYREFLDKLIIAKVSAKERALDREILNKLIQ